MFTMTDQAPPEELSFLEKLANDVLDGADQLVERFEEGVNVLMTGNLKGTEEATENPSGAPIGGGDPFDEDFTIEIDEEDIMDGGTPLEGIADSVLKDIVSSQVLPETPMEHFHAFRSAITWSEPFILSLLVFQFVMLVLCLWVSRKDQPIAARIVVMVLIGVLVRGAAYINEYGAQHWEGFSTQNYFDRQGIFIGIMLCGPLLLDAFIMVCMFLREASQLLVEVKTMELKKKREAQKKKSSDENQSSSNKTRRSKKKVSKKED